MATQSGTLGSSGATLAVSTDAGGVGAGCVAFNIVPNGSPSITLLFEATTDAPGGVQNWFAVAAHQLLASGLLSGPTTFTVTNPTAALQMMVPVYGYAQVRCRMSVWTSGSTYIAADLATSAPTGMQYMDIEGQKPTYSGQILALLPYATPTDVVVWSGSATKTVKMTRLSIMGTATAAAALDISLIKRSTADTGGTTSAAPMNPHDANDPAATSAPLLYTAAPGALGTAVGTLRAARLYLGATPAPGQPQSWEFGAGRQGRCPTLRGVAQQLALNFGGAAVPAGTSLDIEYELTEE